ncbi:DUF4469 domain-containing protein [Aliifodinibius sp. S!AR15-10]|uniref:DUF4469 domain-containing protein n=1 Tax=Aliifodinibius sp. S!AR15-10 TaxID=2950437 RepID=UPI00286115D0|nr:DUF4469 domain-containing protein [Aliifodinibius sp. S!AR15-10]MDR8389584.1 DUF4469 domain-containing protein [Aliifodinibius sp. S!AR15-10]
MNINFSSGVWLRDLPREIPTEKIEPNEREPKLRHYYDSQTGSQDETITPLAGARITGALLKFDEEDLSQGVFFYQYQRR